VVLGVDKLLELVEKQKLVENLCERELTNPEGTGFDLRVGELFKISGEGYLGETERKTCDIESVAKYEEGKVTTHVIKPGDFYLFKTIETVNIPDNLVAEFKPRTTMQRMGIFFRSSQASPGYSGELTFAIANVGPCEVKLEMGARVCHVIFHEVNGKTHLYRGQWQGGRVTTGEKEVQV
jgi:deoxycytidine triphosphate deaminase